ncbi:unnamed protein product [Lota lota]
MGCIHSALIRKGANRGTSMDHDPHTDPSVSPGILQLAGVGGRERPFCFTAVCFRICIGWLVKWSSSVILAGAKGTFCACKRGHLLRCKAGHRCCLTSTCNSASDLRGSITSTFQKKRGSLPRSKSVELVMEQVMERHYDFDLTYITERIISVFFLPDLEEQRYRGNLQEVAAMLKSKHQDKFLLLNLSEKRHDIARLNPKVDDYGWPDHHAPPLDRICAVCKAMDTWLISDPQNVVVLHCKGNKGKTGVIVAAYMHYSKITAGADQALTTLAMRKFCEDKVSSSLQPSQNRYIYYFGGLLSGSIKMNSSPLFLQQILIPSLPNFQAEGGYYPFLKIYQSLQLVYTSGIYDPQNSRARKLCVTMEPALLLKGDIMVKCYHRRPRSAQREVVFRVQFHTCTVHGAQLWFGKTELDSACSDDRFPPDSTVEFIFSGSPDKIKGRECQKNEPSITVDYITSDPVVRWDSYENFNLHHQDSLEKIPHTRGPLDGSLYAQVRKRRGPGSPNGQLPLSPTVGPQTQAPPPQHPASFSPDPGRSSAPPSSDRPEEPSASPTRPQRDGEGAERRAEGAERRAEVVERRAEGAERRAEVVERRAERRAEGAERWAEGAERRAEGEDRARDNAGRGKERDRETAILDDAEPSGAGGSRRGRPCCSPAGAGRLGEGGWERGRELCLANNGHHPAHRATATATTKNNPKSRTLPALPSKPISPTPHHAPHMELYHRHSGHPLPELPWECPPAPMLCVHRACFPHSTPELAHPHSFSLPAPSRECSGEECHLVHYSGHGPPSLPTSPYRELFFHPPTAPPGCGCRDCASRREHQSASVRLFHPLHSDKSGSLHWGREPYRVCHSSLEQPQTTDQAGSVLVLHPGYRTPPPAHLPCACIPYQSSPAESHESRGYASGYQSGSSSPLPPTSPMPGAPSGRSQAAESPSRARGPPESNHHTGKRVVPVTGQYQSSTPASAHSPQGSPARGSSPQRPLLTADQAGPRLSPDRDSPSDPAKPPSPVPDGYSTPTFPLASYYYPLLNVPRVPYTGYTAVTIPAPQPPLPEKKRFSSSPLALNGHSSLLRAASAPSSSSSISSSTSSSTASSSSSSSGQHHVTFSPSVAEPPPPGRRGSGCREEADTKVNAKFVQDSSKYWYKPGISRDQAIAVLKDKEPGAFLIRDSNSFQGAYGLALKVTTPPLNANLNASKGEPLEQLVRHFLIETGSRGVKIKGCQNESYFGSLSALVYQHSITPISLPCALLVPDKDLVGELQEIQSVTNTSTAANLLKQGAACNVLYLNSVETESLTGPQAISKATKCTLALSPRPTATVVHFKVSMQGITLTDSKRRLFFRRHYPINSVTFSSLDPKDQRWTNSNSTSSKIFGFVARRTGSTTENVCHLFAEIDPEQPAVAIVNFINKVMLGPQLRR